MGLVVGTISRTAKVPLVTRNLKEAAGLVSVLSEEAANDPERTVLKVANIIIRPMVTIFFSDSNSYKDFSKENLPYYRKDLP
jgi:hypothetical protein